MRKRKRLWVLMYKKDGRHKVWIYEKLRKKEITRYEKHGWKVIENEQHTTSSNDL